jgi:vacuole morphology and inheritance protein 14
LKGRDEGIRWGELLEKFRAVQERARRAARAGEEEAEPWSGFDGRGGIEGQMDLKASRDLRDAVRPPSTELPIRQAAGPGPAAAVKPKSGLAKFSRLSGGGNKVKK